VHRIDSELFGDARYRELLPHQAVDSPAQCGWAGDDDCARRDEAIVLGVSRLTRENKLTIQNPRKFINVSGDASATSGHRGRINQDAHAVGER
jgi:hypothetical protein